MTTRDLPQLPGVEHRFVDVAGLRTHVALAGDSDPLVLLHGWPQHWWQWHEIIGPLAEHYRVICPDLRGLGWTDAPADGYDAATMATDVLGLLDALDIGRFGLVGHDWGGAAGYLIALRRPDRVTGFVAINTASPILRPTPRVIGNATRLWHILLNCLPLGAGTITPRWALRHWAATPTAISHDDRGHFLAQFREPARVHATATYYRTLVARDIPRTLIGAFRWLPLAVPTLVLSGDRDPLLPSSQMTGYGPTAHDLRVRLIPDCGHFPANEAPTVVATELLRFFATAPDLRLRQPSDA